MSTLAMSDRVHRIIGFVTAILVGVISYAALGDVLSHAAIGYIAFATFVLQAVGNSWRILFPEDKP